MKSTSNRFYFDYNATSPLSESVLNWLESGDLPFGNPSSIHSSGKKSRKFINETISTIKSIFSANNYNVIFHSGATEGINNIVKGQLLSALRENKSFEFFHLKTDHSCVQNQKEDLELLGAKVTEIEVDENGEFNLESVISLINQSSADLKLLNFTWVNNETGVVLPLDLALKIKEQTCCLVHVDAVQAPGKIEDWKEISNELDFYTYSAHKFGGLKGVGFSLMRDELKISPLILGGGQQGGLRSGTENSISVYTIKLALDDLCKDFNFTETQRAKNFIEDNLVELSQKISIVAKGAKSRNCTTIYMTLDGVKTDVLLVSFDMAKVDLSSGSACSSGAVIASRVLLSMGVEEQRAKSALRFSFSPLMTLDEAKEYYLKIESVLKRFL